MALIHLMLSGPCHRIQAAMHSARTLYLGPPPPYLWHQQVVDEERQRKAKKGQQSLGGEGEGRQGCVLEDSHLGGGAGGGQPYQGEGRCVCV